MIISYHQIYGLSLIGWLLSLLLLINLKTHGEGVIIKILKTYVFLASSDFEKKEKKMKTPGS